MKPCSSLLFLALATLTPPSHASFPSGEDNFADATVVTTQNDVSAWTSLQSKTAEVGEPKHRPDFQDGSNNTVWWKWTAPESGFCHIDTATDSNINEVTDTVLSIYTGSALNALTRIASNNDWTYPFFASNYRQSKTTFYATTGTTYYIAVDGAYAGTVSAQSQIVTMRLRQIPAQANTRRAVWFMGAELESAGSITMTTTTRGTYSAVFQRGAVRYPFTGVFDRDGTTVRSVYPIVPKGSPPAAPITLRIDGAGSGQYSLETDTFTVGAAFPRQMVYSKTVLNPLVGIYNMGGQNATQDHHERGWMQARVSATGAVTFVGTGPDGFKFTVGSFMHEVSNSSTDFYLPAFAPLHKSKGFIHFPGSATLLTNVLNDPQITANCWYQRPSAPTLPFYRFGYLNTFELKGKRYAKPALNQRAQGFLDTTGNGELRIRGSMGEMVDPISEPLTMNTANKITFAVPLPRKLSLSVNTATGLVTGSITTTDNILGVTKPRVRRLQGLIFREGPNVWMRGHATGVTKNLFMEVVYTF